MSFSCNGGQDRLTEDMSTGGTLGGERLYLLQVVQVHSFSVAFNHPVSAAHEEQLLVLNVHPVSSWPHCPGDSHVLPI